MADDALAMSRCHPTRGASTDLIRRPGDRRATRRTIAIGCACHVNPGSQAGTAEWSWSGRSMAHRGRFRISRFHTRSSPTHVIAAPVTVIPD